MNISGIIKLISETKEYGSNGFKKRELVITTQEQYPQTLCVEFVQDKMSLLDDFQEGQEVVWIVHQVETETNFLIIANTEAEVFSPNTEADVVLYQVNPFVYLGCRDSIACNYNPNANLDDGSCNYPEPYQDCNGICYNDIDLDGVCDEVDYDDGIGIDELKHETPKLTKVVDVLGRTQVNYVKGLILIELYDDGSAVKRIVFD